MDSEYINGVGTLMEKNGETESSGACRLCHHSSVKFCKRCGDYYCSEKCQYIDWPNHRYICFPMPPLVSTRDLVNDEDIFCINPPGLTEDKSIELKKLCSIIEIIMEKVQNIEDKIADRTMNMSGVKTSVNNSHGSEKVNDDLEGTQTPEIVIDAPKETEKHINDFHELNRDINSPQDASNSQESNSKVTHSNSVILCAFCSTNRCAIRSKDAKTESAFRTVIEQIHEYGRNAPPLETMPNIGALAITLKSKKYYTRVKVLKAEKDEKIKVLFCDFGYTVCRKLADLRAITDEISSLPEYISIVQLHGIPMHKYSGYITDFLKSFEREEYRIEYIHENGNALVKLYDTQNDQLLNDVISKFYSENVKTPKTVPIRQISHSNKSNFIIEKSESNINRKAENENIPPFQTYPFAENSTNIEAVVIDTVLIECGYMACIDKKNMDYLSKIKISLNNMELGNQPYEPKLNEYCIAQYENEWFRGRVVNIYGSGTRFDISSMDFFNEVTVASDNIRPYPKDFKFDCYTTLCKIDNLPKNLKDDHKKFLKSKIKINDEILIDRVIKITGQVALVECSKIIIDMHAENLI